ncbi:MAG: hypothetical protein ACYDCK_01285 [Thermoplasmatota archaeon]
MQVSEPRIQRAIDALEARGLVSENAGEMRSTPTWRAALLKAAGELNASVAASGENPAPGSKPLAVAVARAMKNLGLDALPKNERDEMHYVLLMLELARMSPGERARQGFAEVVF